MNGYVVLSKIIENLNFQFFFIMNGLIEELVSVLESIENKGNLGENVYSVCYVN